MLNYLKLLHVHLLDSIIAHKKYITKTNKEARNEEFYFGTSSKKIRTINLLDDKQFIRNKEVIYQYDTDSSDDSTYAVY